MAINRLYSAGTSGNYGQIELNRVSFTKTGNIEAQKPYVNADGTVLENGMLVAVDFGKNQIRLPGASEASPIGVMYGSEKLYDTHTGGLKNFCMKPNKTAPSGRVYGLNDSDFLPRVGFVSVGEVFTDTCLCYDTTEFAADSNVETALAAAATTPVYGSIHTSGAIKITKTKPTVGPVLQVCKKVTTADGTSAVKFAVIA